MSVQAAQAFREQVNQSAPLQAAVAGHINAGVIDFAGLSRLGAAHGFAFSGEDAQVVLGTGTDELSEFEMEIVTGGTSNTCAMPSKGPAFGT